MGWNRKGKFGIHTGRTLRNFPNENAKKCDEFAIVKELKFTDHASQLSFDKSRVDKLGINDGELPLGDGHIVYSMNKHKRWLLPDMVKEDVEQLYRDAISESEQQSRSNSGSTKSCKKPENQDNRVPKLHVTVVERNARSNIERNRPDCTGVMSSSSSLNSSELNRIPRKTYAFVGDLKSRTGSEVDALDAELCYEFLSPFPNKCWPPIRQFAKSYSLYKGTKSKKKCKGRRNKWHQRPNLENNVDSFISYDCDEVTHEESVGFVDSMSPCYFPIGTYIEDMLKYKSTEKQTCLPVKSKKTICSKKSNVALYGKGDAIYMESDDNDISHEINKNLSNQAMIEEIGPLVVDRKMKFGLSMDDISPDNLSQQFGNNYIEDDISPRKFIIKAEWNKSLSSDLKQDTKECCVLFELGELLSSVVEADISVLIPSEHEKPNNLVEILQSELTSLSHVGPLTVKAIVDHTCATFASETSCLSRNSASGKGAPSIAKVLVEYIHNVSERKPEICGIRDAVRYSVKSAAAEANHVQSPHITSIKPSQLCCEICFTDKSMNLGTDFTSLLRCSHRFCNDCWALYLMACISLGQTCITCPHFQCKTVIGEPLVWSQTNSEIYQRYMRLKHNVVIGMDQKFRHCPSADCTHIAYIDSLPESSLGLPILCVCGQMWCFGCQKDSHWPASCEEAESFRNKCDDYESLKKTYRLPGRISSVQVKRCPFCSYPMEKSFGCQHMSCHCGNEFCWECLNPWNNHDWNKCDERRKKLEDVELAFDLGSARFRKYSKIAVDNFIERSGKKLAAFWRLTKKAKSVRKYSENSQETFLERILHFKYLAHVVLENSAVSLAVSKTKIMLKSLDKYMHRLDFIVQRLTELVYHPTIRLDEKNIESVNLLLSQGEQLIRNIHQYTRAKKNIRFAH